MSKGRLTRQELGWLLTQEAQGAAERLRVGVKVLKTNAPPPIIAEVADESPPPSGHGLEASLAALDDVMRMLSSLHPKPASAMRGARRGRIDLAGLIWEVAPEARVSIEPGSGTEVYGDEGEIRRMLHVLVGHGSGVSGGSMASSGSVESAVTIKREADYVRVSVVLGPDSSATADTERAWLSRMAVRYGGRHELEGGTESLSLPAEDVNARDEREALRKELDEARKQGEAYARELAAVFAHGEEITTPSSFPPANQDAGTERLSVLSRFSGGVAAELRSMLSPIGRELGSLRAPEARIGTSSRPPPPMTASGHVEEPEDRLELIRRRLVHVQDFVGELASIGELDAEEPLVDTDLTELARSAARALASRMQRQEVEVEINAPEGVPAIARVAPRAAAVLVRQLIGQGIVASQRGGKVVVTLTPKGTGQGEESHLGTRLTVDDAGPALPGPARRALLNLELDPGTYGRPSSIPLYVAGEIAVWLGALLDLGDAPVAGASAGGGGGLRVIVTFPR